MTVDVLIAGGGIAGLLLARALRRRGRSVIVATDAAQPPAAQAAVGLLNPVIGQRFTLAWRVAETLPLARATYAELSREFGEPLWRELPILRVLRDDAEHAAWEAHRDALIAAGFTVQSKISWPRGLVRDERETIGISGAGVVSAWRLVECLRGELSASGTLLEQAVEPQELDLRPDGVTWRRTGITAHAFVLAEGAGVSPLTRLSASLAERADGFQLPVRPVKGETLLVHAPNAEPSAIIVCGHFAAPRGNGEWICGSTIEPRNLDAGPTAAGREELESFLHATFASPWRVIDQRAGFRPTTPDLRPIVGRWLQSAPVFVCNGLGSRGLALAPWLAEKLAAHLIADEALPAEILPARFAPLPPHELRWHATDVARTEALLRVRPGDTVVDLTVGNGGDTVWLANAVGAGGVVLGFDIQPEAITATQRRLAAQGIEAGVQLFCTDHARMAEYVSAPLAAAVANLGHLPGSASPIITQPSSTLAAFDAACDRLRGGGVLVAVIYTGHPGGAEEYTAITSWVEKLPPAIWLVRWHRHPANARHAPIVLVVEKRRSRDV